MGPFRPVLRPVLLCVLAPWPGGMLMRLLFDNRAATTASEMELRAAARFPQESWMSATQPSAPRRPWMSWRQSTCPGLPRRLFRFAADPGSRGISEMLCRIFATLRQGVRWCVCQLLAVTGEEVPHGDWPPLLWTPPMRKCLELNRASKINQRRSVILDFGIYDIANIPHELGVGG